ncbi:MAG: hypothetical protein EBZ47_07895 [Chlamydiae bacterium]|nr:hypothetical protein [Chlamydiota bacterium]
MTRSFLVLASVFLLFMNIEGRELKGYLSQEEIELFHKQGYLKKSNCLNGNEMVLIQHHVNEAIRKAYEKSREETFKDFQLEHFFFLEGSRVVLNTKKAIARINGCCGIEPDLSQFIQSPKILYTFFELLGTNDLEHLIAQIHPKLPVDQVAFPAHRDIDFRKSFDPEWQDILGNGSWVICILPIDPMNQNNGGLWIDPKSFNESSSDMDIFWVDAQPGDLFFLHPYILHGSGPNESRDASRKTLLTGFCAYGANHRAYPGA